MKRYGKLSPKAYYEAVFGPGSFEILLKHGQAGLIEAVARRQAEERDYASRQRVRQAQKTRPRVAHEEGEE